jgi:serine/threonine-protein kinase
VWLAQDQELGEWVAIKVFSPELSETDRERLRREVRWGRTLLHPGLVRLYELVESDGRLALVMEWLSGGSLVGRLRAGPLPVDEVVRIADKVLATLEYIHAQGVVHRDVKPSNLLLDGEGQVRLGDLGLARPLTGGIDLTRTNMTVGTPGFMSPEQLRGETLTPATDLYSLGATMYQLLTGGLVFEGSSHFEVARHHLSTLPQDPRRLRRDCPRWLARFVLRLLEKRPEDRWPNAGEARLALHRRANLTSPRVWRRAIVAAGVAGLLVALGTIGETVVYPRVRRGETVKVEAVEQEVHGLDKWGKTTWHIGLADPVQHVVSADLDGDGKRETVITAYPRRFAREGEAMTPADILVVRNDGTVLTRVHPEDVITDGWAFPYPKVLAPEPHLIDLDSDGRLELVVLCPQRGFYPFALLVYWPRRDLWDCVLVHSGWMSGVAAVPGSSPPRLRIAGVNNRLGFLPVVGEVMLPPSGPGDPLGVATSLGSPDFGWGGIGRFSYNWYTLLEQGAQPSRISVESDGGSEVTLRGVLEREKIVHVDRLGNPVPGPNVGRDLRALRGWFLEQLRTLTVSEQTSNVASLEAHVAAIRSGAGPLLAEVPYRAILGEARGRALARLGDVDAGIRVLQQTLLESQFEEARFRLIQLQALSGRLDDAIGLATAMVNSPRNDRGDYDGVQLLVRLAVERRDDSLLRNALIRIGKFEGVTSSEMTRLNATLWGRAHLWWDEIGEADCAVRSWNYAPEGDALACLARWRLGRTQPDDPEAMRTAIERNPDAAWEGHVALAAAQLGVGKARDAVGTTERTIESLEPLSRDDFQNRQVLDLASALHAKALLAAGEREQAFRAAEALRPQLRPGLLPRILVDEVLGNGKLDGR